MNSNGLAACNCYPGFAGMYCQTCTNPKLAEIFLSQYNKNKNKNKGK